MSTLEKKFVAVPGSKSNLAFEAAKPISEQRASLLTQLALMLFMVFAAFVSIANLSKQSLRLDEAQTLWQSSPSPMGILKIIASDVHVPLYPLLIHYWQLLFGNGVAQVRFFSLIFFLASIPAMYFLGKTSYNRSVGLFSALLTAVSPFLNWYGNETRMYSLLTFITIINHYFLVKIFKYDRTDKTTAPIGWLWLGYGLTAFLGIYTHYFFWLLLISHAVFFVFTKKLFPKNTLRNFTITAAILVASLAPWAYYVYRLGFIANSTPSLQKPNTTDLFNSFSQFIFGFQNDHINTVIISLWPTGVLFGFLALRKNKKIPPLAAYFFVCSLVPIILAFLVSVAVKPLFLSRYLILCVPSLFIFLSWFFDMFAKKVSLALVSSLALIMLLTLSGQITKADTPVKEDYKDLSIFLNQNVTPQDAIIISAPFTVYPIEYYYRGPAQLETIPFWNRFIPGAIPAFSPEKLVAEINTLKASHQKAYLVLSYDQGYQKTIQDYFGNHFTLLDKKNFSPNLDLYVYQLRYDKVSFDGIINNKNPP